MQHSSSEVLVVGGGWAGLACAAALVQAGRRVRLIDAARQLGGRARAVEWKGRRIDNGQHLMLGAYQGVLQLLKMLGVDPRQALRRRRLELNYRALSGEDFVLRAPFLPAPLHLALGLARAQGFSGEEKRRALGFVWRMRRAGFTLRNDTSVLELLNRHRQSERLIYALWEPLCLGALNVTAAQASAEIFLRVLRDSFSKRRAASDLLFYTRDLSTLLAEPARDYILKHGGEIINNERAHALVVKSRQVMAAVGEATEHTFRNIVLATPHHITRQLVDGHPELENLTSKLAEIQTSPICTVYLQYAPETSLGRDMLGLLNATGQWVFDRALNGQPGLMAVVVSGDGPHMDMDNEPLCRRIADELARLFPHWPAPLESIAIREKRATFRCAVNCNQIRPDNQTAVKGLWLAGDYTDTGLPATLEGAVCSGLRCARQLLENTSALR